MYDEELQKFRNSIMKIYMKASSNKENGIEYEKSKQIMETCDEILRLFDNATGERYMKPLPDEKKKCIEDKNYIDKYFMYDGDGYIYDRETGEQVAKYK